MSNIAKSNEDICERQFDAYCKVCLKNMVLDKMRQYNPIAMNELPFTELSPTVVAKLCIEDRPQLQRMKVDAVEQSIEISDDQLAMALQSLSEPRKTIVILYYFLDYTDVAIADIMGIRQVTVRYHRLFALKLLKKALEAIAREDEA